MRNRTKMQSLKLRPAAPSSAQDKRPNERHGNAAPGRVRKDCGAFGLGLGGGGFHEPGRRPLLGRLQQEPAHRHSVTVAALIRRIAALFRAAISPRAAVRTSSAPPGSA